MSSKKEEFETYRGVVYPWECDFNGHMNVQFYVSRFDHATWQFLSRLGVTRASLEKENKATVAVEQRIKYFKELFPGDLILIKSKLIEERGRSIVFKHTMFELDTKTVVSEVEMTGVCIDRDTRKATSLPKRFDT